MNGDQIAAALSGDAAAVEALLAADAEMVWWSGGDWECHGRDQVLEVMRRARAAPGGLFPAGVGVEIIDDDRLLVYDARGNDGDCLALAVTVAGGRVTRVVQYGSTVHAREHLGLGEARAAVVDGPAMTGVLLDTSEPLAVAAVAATHQGDVAELRRLLTAHPELATARLGSTGTAGMSRTLLHVVTDWPGHFPNGPELVAALVAAGADVNARFVGGHRETPLHWAASSDDVAVLDALLDAGADIEADGAVIADGTPLSDATAFGQWAAARRLVERGATARLGEAASLGLMDPLTEFFVRTPAPTTDEITGALWMACHGGQAAAADYLLDHGADLNWIGFDDLTPLDAAQRSGAVDLVTRLSARGARSAPEVRGNG